MKKREKPELEVIDTEPALAETIETGESFSTEQLAASPPSLLPEVERDSYEFGGELARGGMGRILAAEDRRMGRPVVVKELIYDEPTLAARFEREALLTGRLQHPSIVPIYEAGRWPTGEPFYAMKRVDGQPFDKLIDAAETLRDRLGLLSNVIGVAEAIAYAHSRRIIHRDLKPANILVGSFGETVVIDWGLAKDLDAEEAPEPEPPEATAGSGKGLTAYGVVLGTPAYMPPEQARGEVVDERADVYAIGALLYHTVSGQPTYTGKSSRDVLDKVIAGPPPDIAELEPDLPADLVTIVNKAMAHDRDNRYSDGGELAAELRRFTSGQLVGAHEYTTVALIARWVRRHRAAVVIGAASIALLGVAIGLAIARVKAEAKEARARLSDLLVEQGRQELMDNRPLRAGAYFAEAIAQGRSIDRAFSTMLRQAIEPARSVDAVLERHGAPLTAVAVTSDGTRAWTASEDGTLRLWSLPGGKHIRAVRMGEPIKDMILSPTDDRMIVILPEEVQLWDTEQTVKVATTWRKYRSRPHVVFSSDGTRFVLSGISTFARVQDAKTVEVLGVLRGHEQPVLAAAFSPDGSRIITASVDATARVWDSSSFEQLAVLKHWTDFSKTPILAARLSPDNKQAITAAGRKFVAVWDLETQREIRRYHVGAKDLRYSPDGTEIISLAATVTVWSDDTEHPIARLAHPGQPSRIALDGSGQRLLVIGNTGAQMVWNTSDWSQLGSLRWHEPGPSATFTPDGKRVVAAGGWAAVVWRPSGGVVQRAFGEERGVLSAALRGSRIMTASMTGISVWDRATAKELAHIDAEVRAVVMSAAGDRIAYHTTRDQLAHIADATTGAEIAAVGRPSGQDQTQPIGPPIDARVMDFSPDGTLIASVLFGGGAHVWRVDGGEHLRELSDGVFGKTDVVFSNDGRSLAVLNKNRLALWDVSRWTKTWERTLSAATQLGAIEFARDDSLLAVGSSDGGIWIINIDGSDVWNSEVIHRSVIGKMRIVDLDGVPSLISASSDHSISTVDLATGELRHRLEGHRDQVSCLGVDPTGELIASASTHSSIVWDARTGRPIAELITPLGQSLACDFTEDSSAVLVSTGDGVTLWSIGRAHPSTDDLAKLRRWWKLERGNLIRR